MTPTERQALREKHQRCTCNYCDHNECRALCGGGYPCDAIKMLDAYEELLEAAEKIFGLGKSTDRFDGIDQLFLAYINNKV